MLISPVLEACLQVVELAVERCDCCEVALDVDASDVDVGNDAVPNQLVGELQVCTSAAYASTSLIAVMRVYI